MYIFVAARGNITTAMCPTTRVQNTWTSTVRPPRCLKPSRRTRKHRTTTNEMCGSSHILAWGGGPTHGVYSWLSSKPPLFVLLFCGMWHAAFVCVARLCFALSLHMVKHAELLARRTVCMIRSVIFPDSCSSVHITQITQMAFLKQSSAR